MIGVIIVLLLVAVIIVLIAKNSILGYKNKYYEGTLMNNEDKFSRDRYSQVERVIQLTNLETLKRVFTDNE